MPKSIGKQARSRSQSKWPVSKKGAVKWVIDYYDQFGKRHWETVGTSKKKAGDRLAERLLDIRKGAYNPALSKTPLGEYADRWLRTYAEINLKASTIKSYKASLKSYILPIMGHIPLKSITRDMVKQLIAQLAKTGLSRNSTRIVYATLRVILNCAVDDGLLAGNPARRVGRFARNKAEHQARGARAFP